MTVVLLSSTLSFAVDRHYCGDVLIDTAVFQQAHDCGMESGPEDNLPAGCEDISKDCCHNEMVQVSGQDELLTATISPTPDPAFVAVFFTTYFHLFESPLIQVFPEGYPPPLIVRDLPVLYETFLI